MGAGPDVGELQEDILDGVRGTNAIGKLEHVVPTWRPHGRSRW